MIKAILFFLLPIVVLSCSDKEVTIFSIPDDAKPSELEKQGFLIMRDLNFNGAIDRWHSGKIQYCELDLAYARINISYPDNDTLHFDRYVINIDIKPFEQMTGLKAKDYESIEIDGFKYKIKMSDTKMSLVLNRLGL